jgi:hypothetical protein
MKKLLTIAMASILLSGCASFDGRGLVPGKSTRAEVEALMGPPAQQLKLADGGSALYFSRMPEGRAVFEVDVGPDGVMKSIEQKLTRQHIYEIATGTSTTDDVLRLFGPPGRRGRLALKAQDWWEYKYQDYQDYRILYVQFSDDGVAREVLDLRDLSKEPGGRRKR